MQLARVIGNVVATVKAKEYEGHRLLLVRPETADGDACGADLYCGGPCGCGAGGQSALDEGGVQREGYAGERERADTCGGCGDSRSSGAVARLMRGRV